MPIETQGLFAPKTQFKTKAQNICKKNSKCQLKIYNKHMFQALCNNPQKNTNDYLTQCKNLESNDALSLQTY
jgi:hypothetical protein